jgi:hypothetical protein
VVLGEEGDQEEEGGTRNIENNLKKKEKLRIRPLPSTQSCHCSRPKKNIHFFDGKMKKYLNVFPPQIFRFSRPVLCDRKRFCGQLFKKKKDKEERR